MKASIRSTGLCVVLGLLAAGSARGAGTEFDFKDPKGVNSISFTLDPLVEPFTGVASGISGKATFDPADPKATKGTITVEAKSLHLMNKGMQDTLQGPDSGPARINGTIGQHGQFGAVSSSAVSCRKCSLSGCGTGECRFIPLSRVVASDRKSL